MNLFLVRHGQTAHNRDGLGLGRADVSLTALGHAQAASVAARLGGEPLAAIYSSPLARALDFARAIAGERGIPVEPRNQLLELDVGETEGLPMADIGQRFAGFLEQWRSPQGHLARMPGGESIADLDQRLSSFLAELREVAPRLPAVAIVSHNFALRVLICRLLGLEVSKFRRLGVDVASIATVRYNPPRVSLVALNDTCHLHNLEPMDEGA